ncbi:AlpA family phage regulatory protein [Thauera aminoaromatica]|uniref:AlpA family phage regulatory protein n=1 Tax=Thauera aminoaromatica TaxID=164330 RepID=A0A5C7SS76_THASP|nr:AlpA family phage regulatory protein [Thauera aminoaromatica]TXH85591.1 MAG: AlpA family phage regulatory protein [Thauera aminoaromatica]
MNPEISRDFAAPAIDTATPSAAAIPDALANFDQLPNSANVRLPVVMALFACSPATVWRRVKKGTLPAPRKLSEAVTAWNVGELRKALRGEQWK